MAEPAGVPAEIPISARELLRDFETVKGAPYFTMDGTTPVEAAFRRLLHSSSAPAAQCRKLVSGGSVAGQVYGMLGLKLLNDPAYALIAPRYKASRQEITVWRDAVSGPMPLELIAEQIDDGSIR